MSEENVEIVRRVYEAVARRDTETVFALYDHEVEWDFSRSPFRNVVGTTRYRGHEGLRRWWREWGEAWTNYEDSCDELIDAGRHVISVVHSEAHGRASGAKVTLRQYGVWTIREGKVVRVVWLPTREEALEAAGLAH
jgi:ketosteroid isomerase-like protein